MESRTGLNRLLRGGQFEWPLWIIFDQFGVASDVGYAPREADIGTTGVYYECTP